MTIRNTSLLCRAALCALPLAVAASPAAAQWWWPPGARVEPECVHPTSRTKVILSGDWFESCPPNTADVVVRGNEIDLNTRIEPEPGFCLTVITPFQLEIDIGPLDAGTYTVYGTHFRNNEPQTNRERLTVIEVDPTCPGSCYADCNADGQLTIDDFLCFMDEFAAAQQLPEPEQITHYANCNGNTTSPVLTVDDFLCFMDEFARGCP